MQLQTAGTRRSFHFASLANATVDAAEAAIAQLHAVTHTPWYITIPLVALGVSLVVRLPSTLHSNSIVAKRARLDPMLQAWMKLHMQNVVKEEQQKQQEAKLAAHSAEPFALSMSQMQSEVLKRHRKTASRMFSAFGVQTWKMYSNILALPPWLVVIEALRRMSGAPTGLLGLLFRRSGGDEAAAAAAVTEASAATASAASASAENVDVASMASATSSSSSAVTDTVASLGADPTLATGGCLWFPDLTVADPYHVLPFALSAMLVINILPKSDAARRALFGLEPKGNSVASLSRGSTILQRSLLLVSLAVGPMTMASPAAIHLYWIASTAFTYAIGRIVNILRPIRTTNFAQTNNQNLPWIMPRAPAKKAAEKQ